jgi:hypothetical protein
MTEYSSIPIFLDCPCHTRAELLKVVVSAGSMRLERVHDISVHGSIDLLLQGRSARKARNIKRKTKAKPFQCDLLDSSE